MKRTLLVVALSISVLNVSVACAHSQAPAPPTKTAAQMTFTTPQAAVEMLIKATADYDVPTLKQLFGPAGDDLIASADPVRDKNAILAFADLARKKNTVNIDPKQPSRAIVIVGDYDWPLPVPLVKKSGNGISIQLRVARKSYTGASAAMSWMLSRFAKTMSRHSNSTRRRFMTVQS